MTFCIERALSSSIDRSRLEEVRCRYVYTKPIILFCAVDRGPFEGRGRGLSPQPVVIIIASCGTIEQCPSHTQVCFK